MRRVLVVQLARFGDLVQSKRLIRSLARDAEVHLCLDASLAPLARILYPGAELHALPAHRADHGPADVFGLAKQAFGALSLLDFSQVYVLNYSPLAFAVAGLFAPEQLRGYGRIKGQDMRGDWLSLCASLVKDRRFSPLNLMDLWAFLHPEPVGPETVNPIAKAAGTGRIGIVTAGRESRRSLPAEVLSRCVQAVFAARNGPEIVLIGSKLESAAARRLRKELPPAVAEKCRDLTGATALDDLPELLSGLDLLLTPDTGVMHLAAHLGVPVQAFFLSSAWCWETGPYGFGHTVWQALEPCSPCLESAACPYSLACLAPFGKPGFLTHMSGKYGPAWPENLLGCVSALDDMGVVYRTVDGGDPYGDARRELRNALADLVRREPESGLRPVRHELADYLFRERDWMTPPNRL